MHPTIQFNTHYQERRTSIQTSKLKGTNLLRDFAISPFGHVTNAVEQSMIEKKGSFTSTFSHCVRNSAHTMYKGINGITYEKFEGYNNHHDHN